MGARKIKTAVSTETATTNTTNTAPIAPSEAITMPGEGIGARIAKRDLKALVARFATVVDRKSTMPILANVSIRASATGLTLTGTDLNVSLRVDCTDPCTIARVGSVSVPAKRLADIVKSLPDGEITLYQTTKTSLTLASGAASASLDGMHDRDTPKFPDAPDGAEWSLIETDALVSCLDAAQHAICLDETRFHLNGTLIEASAGSLRAVATDGHRLAKVERELGTARELTITGALFPRKGCKEICKLVSSKVSPHVSLHVDTKSKRAWVRQGNALLFVKLIDAQFPPYDQVIPKDHKRLVVVDAKALSEALTRAKVNCSDTRGVKLSLASGNLRVSADLPDAGAESKEDLAAEYTCTECEIGVNPRYLIDALAEISGRVVIALGEPHPKTGMLDPMLVRSVDDAAMRPIMGARFLSVVMPMRI